MNKTEIFEAANAPTSAMGPTADSGILNLHTSVSALDVKSAQVSGYILHPATGPALMEWATTMAAAAKTARRNGLDHAAGQTLDLVLDVLASNARGGANFSLWFDPYLHADQIRN